MCFDGSSAEVLYLFARTALTRHRGPSAFSSKNGSSPRSGSQNAELEVLAGLLRPGRICLLPASLPDSGGFLADFGVPWRGEASPELRRHLHVPSPRVRICVFKLPSFYKAARRVGLGAALLHCDLLLT